MEDARFYDTAREAGKIYRDRRSIILSLRFPLKISKNNENVFDIIKDHWDIWKLEIHE